MRVEREKFRILKIQDGGRICTEMLGHYYATIYWQVRGWVYRFDLHTQLVETGDTAKIQLVIYVV